MTFTKNIKKITNLITSRNHTTLFNQKRYNCSIPITNQELNSTTDTLSPNKTVIVLPIQPTLREYQKDCINACLDHISRGIYNIGVSVATGGGKTVIFSNLIKNYKNLLSLSNPQNNNVPPPVFLILVHRRELVYQTYNTIKKFQPDLEVQIEMGKEHTYLTQDLLKSVNNTVKRKRKKKEHPLMVRPDVIIASVQTLSRRLDHYPSHNFLSMIIIDEAHHSVANTYLNILTHFDALPSDDNSSNVKKIPVIGFSATMERQDKKALGQIMQEIVYDRGIFQMIDDGWLCDAKFSLVKTKILNDLNDNSILNKDTNDFVLHKLSGIMNTPEMNQIILQTYLTKVVPKNPSASTLLFGVDIEHVETLNELFLNNGIKSACVTSKTKQFYRDKIVTDFKNGRIDVLMNCGIFTEGTDMPNIDCILLCRPTRSRSLLVQMIGRGLRLHKNKKVCHIIDFVGTSNEVGLVSIPTLAGIGNHINTTSEEEDMNDLLLSELPKLKEKINSDDRSKTLITKHEEDLKRQFREHIEKNNGLDVVFATFDSFKAYYDVSQNSEQKPIDQLNNWEKEYVLIKHSKYPWIKFADKGWALSLSPQYHFRIYKEKKNDGNGSQETIYVLKLYVEFPRPVSAKKDDIYSESDNNKWNNKMKAKIIKSSSKFEDLVGYTEYYLEKYQSHNPQTLVSTRYSNWRKNTPTAKQLNYLKIKAKRFYTKHQPDNILEDDIEEYFNRFNRGECSDLLFALSIAPVYPLDKTFKVIQNRKKLSQLSRSSTSGGSLIEKVLGKTNSINLI
ncbi:related to Putative ATP-dependent helicase IRC3 [Saccharomycodes ludwigii]|uniref:Related to Putative ATP-dependent helicase IRC3 n=1 Tax=Saccharomycodes ludwigii TaxID=36035 RepID=A0A376B318_9ASCO|nr:related to Putative ATP-dependent helicase IRC3 [Saccharomycodes ludwigii]